MGPNRTRWLTRLFALRYKSLSVHWSSGLGERATETSGNGKTISETIVKNAADAKYVEVRLAGILRDRPRGPVMKALFAAESSAAVLAAVALASRRGEIAGMKCAA